MARNTRDTAILAKIEATYGVDSVPTGGANGMLVSAPQITPLNANNIDRDLVRPYFGSSEQLVGTRYVECSFDVELAGSGTAGTPPAFGPLLRACALAETLIAVTRADYTPITNAQESVTIYWYDSGVLHKLTGARGTVDFMLGSGERPVAKFKFSGLYVAISAATPGSVSFALFTTPLAVVDANSGDVTLGATVSPTGAPAITGGTPFPSLGLELTMGNDVPFTPLLGGETVDVTDRKLAGKIKLDLSAAQEVSRMTDVLNATLSAVSLLHGTTAGNRIIVHMPSMQFFNPSKEDLNGRRLIGYDLRGVPTPGGSGNDELRLVFF